MRNTVQNIQKETFYVIGLNYKKADVETRGLFSIDESTKTAILLEAKDKGIPSLAILTTCNRTELYGVSQNPFQLIKLLCKYTKGSLEDFDQLGYVYIGKEAVNHIFLVGAGLDSQILGDFEIISQLRNSFKAAKEEDVLNNYMERLINTVIQASKRIKNETELSTGATSVSFAAVHYLMGNIPQISNKNILLFGTGKIGRNTIDNLVKHIDNKDITLINRTKEKAEDIGGKYNLIVRDFKNLKAEIGRADVVIVATGAQQPTITKTEIQKREKPLWIIDLSVPKNVAQEIEDLGAVKCINVDELSRITAATLEHRKEEVPKAKSIIEDFKQEFLEWGHIRRFAPTIRALKERFNEIKVNEIGYQRKKWEHFEEEQAEALGNRIVQKIITQFASHLRTNDQVLEESLEMISQVFDLNLKE